MEKLYSLNISSKYWELNEALSYSWHNLDYKHSRHKQTENLSDETKRQEMGMSNPNYDRCFYLPEPQKKWLWWIISIAPRKSNDKSIFLKKTWIIFYKR
jgi:hypothetical protein